MKLAGNKKTSLYYLMIITLIFALWGLLHSSIKARYDHFPHTNNIDNFSLTSDFSDSPNPNTLALNTVNQLGNSGFFWSEAAYHYRTTLMYAVDWYQNPSILQNDQWQEFPDGVNAWDKYTVFMEPFLGYSYKWFAAEGQNLIQFLMIVLPLFHALLLLPLFYLAQLFSNNSRWAVVSVLFFATSSLTFSPLLSSFYVKETFSWVLLTVFLVGHFSYLKNGSRPWLLLAAPALLMFLASWHLAQFLTIPIMIASALGQLFIGSKRPEFPNVSANSMNKLKALFTPETIQPSIYLLVFLTVSLAPWLGMQKTLGGVPSLCLFLWVLLSFSSQLGFAPKGLKQQLLLLVAGCLIIFGAGAASYTIGGDYSHVVGLLWHRVIHGFSKPIDPTKLPFEMRVFWVAPFTSPNWQVLKAGLGLNGIILLGSILWGLIWSFRAPKEQSFPKTLIWSISFFLVAFIFVERLAPVFIFLAAIGLSLLGVQLEKTIKNHSLRHLVFFLFLAVPTVNLFWTMGSLVQTTYADIQGRAPRQNHLDMEWNRSCADMLQWIRGNTPTPKIKELGHSSSFLGEIGVSTQILLYSGRPIILNSQFENNKIRFRYQEYLEVLFSEDPFALIHFCQKHHAEYVFISRDWATADGLNSPKYLSGRVGLHSLNSNISKLHFTPRNLQFFKPIYENNHYRVFKFFNNGTVVLEPSFNPSYSRWWDLNSFIASDNHLVNPTLDRVKLRKLDNIFRLLPQKLALLSQHIDQQWQTLNPSSEPRESLFSLHRQYLVTIFEITTKGQTSDLIGFAEKLNSSINLRLEEKNPHSGLTLKNELLELLNGTSSDRLGLLMAIVNFECSPEEYSLVGQILLLSGEYKYAGEFYGKAGALYSKPALTRAPEGRRPSRIQEQLWQETILNLIAGGEISKARNLARFCATHVKPNSAKQQFFIHAANIN